MQDISNIVPEVSILSVSRTIFVSMLNVWVSKAPLKLGVGTPEIGGRTPEFRGRLYAG